MRDMMLLQDEIQIEASPEDVFDWLQHFKENYLAWHPDHVDCQYLNGPPLRVGSMVYTEEYLHGRLHKLTFRVTRMVPNSRVEYTVGPGVKGAFTVVPEDGGVRFVADLAMGTTIPVVGALVDRLLRPLLGGRLDALRRHMAEEGRNLKSLLEGGRKDGERGDLAGGAR